MKKNQSVLWELKVYNKKKDVCIALNPNILFTFANDKLTTFEQNEASNSLRIRWRIIRGFFK